MADVGIDWDSVTIHHGTFTVQLQGAWAHHAEWVAFFNESVPPGFTTSWGQISGTAPTLDAWDQITARDNGVITVHALRPGHASQLRDTLEQYVAAANKKMNAHADAPSRAPQWDPRVQAELDERDRALLDEFRQLSLGVRLGGGPVLPTTRLFGTDGEEIFNIDGWFKHAPPEKKKRDWKDGYSAKEHAKAWLRLGKPAVPEELWSAVSGLMGEVNEIYGRPEHKTKLDDYGRRRQHDIFACARHNGATVAVIGVEAKACETFDGTVRDRAKAESPSKKRARCNLLARALFGCEVMDEETGKIKDTDLAAHGYQLWTAAVGTIIEAQKRGVDQAIVVVHQFRPYDVALPFPPGDKRHWSSALEANALAFDTFAAAIAASGSCSHETESVKAGTAIHLVKIDSLIAPGIEPQRTPS